MDLAKEFLSEVLNERICLASNFSSISGGNEKKNNSSSCQMSATSINNKQQEEALVKASNYLENNLSVSIHVLLGHSECKEAEDKLCQAMQDTEVWTFKLHRQRPPDSIGRPPMLPLFLKQALRSQLHFSPLRSWLTAKTLPTGLFPVVRVLTNDQLFLCSDPSQVQSHKFPACCCSTTTSGGFWLELCVQWLKREFFLLQAPILCPAIEMDCNDSWVLPPLPDVNNGQNKVDEQVQRPSSSLSSSLCSSSSEEDEDLQEEDEDESLLSSSSSSSSSPSPLHSQNVNEHQKKESTNCTENDKNNNAISCNNNINNTSSQTLSRHNSQNIRSIQFINENQNRRERSSQQRLLRSFRPIQSSNNCDNSSNNNNILTSSTPKYSSSHNQLIQNYHHHQFIQRRRLMLQRARKGVKKINNGNAIIEEKILDNNKNQKEEKMEEDKIEEEVKEKKEFNKEENKICIEETEKKLEYSQTNQISSSSCSSTPLSSFHHHPLLHGINTTPTRMLLQQRQHSSLSALHNNNKNLNNPFRRCSSSRLVCNFEESILSGRLMPSSIVDGYSLQLMVVPTQSMIMAPGGGFFSVQRVKYPVQTYFFFNEMASTPDEISTRTPALLHLARCELSPEGIPIPRHCNLQAVLFNPQGSVIKIFMVEVDVRDMPPCSTTFIRQRTFSETTTSTKTTGNNNCFISSTTLSSSNQQAANKNNNDLINNTGLMTTQIMSSSSSTTPNTINNNRMPLPASALRFLIHLRLASNETGCIRLHTDIRMLFSNKSTELEGLDHRLLLLSSSIKNNNNNMNNRNRLSLPPGILEAATNDRGGENNINNNRMHTIAEMPNGPKYSPVK